MNSEYVKELFGAIAPRYALANHLLSLGMDFWWRHCVAQQVQQWAPRHLLDVATGNGDLAAAIKKMAPTIQITGTDFCPEMLSLAQGKNIDCLVEADALNLPFEDASFDVVTVAFGLRNMASWEGALQEMHRVLRKEGHLLILDFSLPSSPLLRPFYRFYLHHILPRLAGWLTGKADAYEYMGQSIESFPSGNALCTLLEQCGFEQTNTKPLTAGIVSVYTASQFSGKN